MAAIGVAIELDGIAVRVAESFGQRLLGLMFSANLPLDEGLLLADCASVHTCFMRYPIDIIYLDQRGVVIQLVPGLAPWRASRGQRGSVQVLELASGSIDRLSLRIGDDLNVMTKRAPSGNVGHRAETQIAHALGAEP